MPGFVKTPEDEKLWSKAKRAAGHTGLSKGSNRFYAFANWWFHKHTNLKEEYSTWEYDKYLTGFKTWFNSIEEAQKRDGRDHSWDLHTIKNDNPPHSFQPARKSLGLKGKGIPTAPLNFQGQNPTQEDRKKGRFTPG